MESPGLDQTQWFAKHVQPHEAMLRGWLVGIFSPRLAGDDLVQEAFWRVLRTQAAGGFHSPKAFHFATAHPLAINQLRRRHVARTDSSV